MNEIELRKWAIERATYTAGSEASTADIIDCAEQILSFVVPQIEPTPEPLSEAA